MDADWVTTGEAAAVLGVSRQHVVNLCDRGELEHRLVGRHRRVRASALNELSSPHLTPEAEKSLWLHRAVLGELMSDPDGVRERARRNLQRWEALHRADGMTRRYMDAWGDLLEGELEALVTVLTSRVSTAVELRQNSPFAGVLSDGQRMQVLAAFREQRDRLVA